MTGLGAFLINSFSAVGMQPAIDDGIKNVSRSDLSPKMSMQWEFKKERSFTLAGHRSHSSHRSHGSHRSSSSGSYTPRNTPTYVPPPVKKVKPKTSNSTSNSTPPDSILPRSPATSPKVTKLNGNSKAFRVLVMQVQTALFAAGYYAGSIDGLAGPNTTLAIAKYEVQNGLNVTGRLSDKLLDRMNIDTTIIEKQTK